MIEVARRSFITGLIALVAAPAIVRAGSIMPVKAVAWSKDELLALLDRRLDEVVAVMARNLNEAIFGDVIGGGKNWPLAGLVRMEGVPLDRCEGTLFPFKQMTAGFALHG
jgi:hypothetical protein